MVDPDRYSEIALENVTSADCGLIAIQAITGKSRTEAAAMFRAAGGDPDGTGISRADLIDAFLNEGYQVIDQTPNLRGAVDTPGTFAMDHEYGTFLVHVQGHVMALVDGDLHNSRGSWRRQLLAAEEVRR